MDCKQVQSLAETLKQNISTVISGKDSVIEKVILSLLCSGHILLEDIPGTGKTTILRAIIEVFKHLFPESKIMLAAPPGSSPLRSDRHQFLQSKRRRIRL